MSHKSWAGDVDPEAVCREKTCLHAGVLSAMQGYHRRLHRAVLEDKESQCFCAPSALPALGPQSDPAVPQVPCTASAHLTLGLLLSPHTDVPGCTWMQDSNTLGSLDFSSQLWEGKSGPEPHLFI